MLMKEVPEAQWGGNQIAVQREGCPKWRPQRQCLDCRKDLRRVEREGCCMYCVRVCIRVRVCVYCVHACVYVCLCVYNGRRELSVFNTGGKEPVEAKRFQMKERQSTSYPRS